jgi:GTPase Era involved in 16S rRNA processing
VKRPSKAVFDVVRRISPKMTLQAEDELKRLQWRRDRSRERVGSMDNIDPMSETRESRDYSQGPIVDDATLSQMDAAGVDKVTADFVRNFNANAAREEGNNVNNLNYGRGPQFYEDVEMGNSADDTNRYFSSHSPQDVEHETDSHSPDEHLTDFHNNNDNTSNISKPKTNRKPTALENYFATRKTAHSMPVILVLNKCDKQKEFLYILDRRREFQERGHFDKVFYTSAVGQTRGLEKLVEFLVNFADTGTVTSTSSMIPGALHGGLLRSNVGTNAVTSSNENNNSNDNATGENNNSNDNINNATSTITTNDNNSKNNNSPSPLTLPSTSAQAEFLHRTRFHRPWVFPPDVKTSLSKTEQVEQVIRGKLFAWFNRDLPYKIEQQTVGWSCKLDGSLVIEQELTVFSQNL